MLWRLRAQNRFNYLPPRAKISFWIVYPETDALSTMPRFVSFMRRVDDSSAKLGRVVRWVGNSGMDSSERRTQAHDGERQRVAWEMTAATARADNYAGADSFRHTREH